MFQRKFTWPQHLSDDVLIQLLDGELSSKDAAKGKAHLESCWSCRGRAEKFEQTVLRFLEYRKLAVESFGEPPRHWGGFRSALDRQALELAVKNSFSWHLRLSAIGRRVVQPRAITTIAASLALVWWSLTPATRVSANDVLRHSQASEAAALKSYSEPVIHQRLHVRAGTKTAEWDLWRAPLNHRFHQRWSSEDDLSKEIGQVFAVNRFDAEQPLSAENFAAWRESISRKREKVAVYSDRDVIQIFTEAASTPRPGQIRQATLSLRKTDCHPVGQTIRVRSAAGEDTEFEIEETSFSVLPMKLVPVGIFEPVEVLPAEITRAHRVAAGSMESSVTARVLVPTDEQLEDAELRLREALHKVGADLQEVSQIQRENHEVHLRLWAQSSKRKVEILAALEGIPFTSADIYDAEEPANNVSLPAQATQTDARLYPTQPPLAEALSKYLGGLDLANNYLDEIRESYLRVLEQASALEQLTRRYPDEEWNRLPAALQNRLNGLAVDHATKLQANAEAYLKLQSYVLDEMLRKNGLDMTPSQESGLPGCDSWRVVSPGLFVTAQRLQSAFLGLFVEEQRRAPVTLSATELLRESVEARSQMQEALLRLCRK